MNGKPRNKNENLLKNVLCMIGLHKFNSREKVISIYLISHT